MLLLGIIKEIYLRIKINTDKRDIGEIEYLN